MALRHWGGLGVWGLSAVLVASACGRSAGDRDPDASCGRDEECEVGQVCRAGACESAVGAGGEQGEESGGSSSAVGGFVGSAGDGDVGGASSFGGFETGVGGDGLAGAAGQGTGGQPPTCEPRSTWCDGPSVRVCDAFGDESTILETCKLSQVCRDAACHDIVCVPEKTFCDGNVVRVCEPDGTGSTTLTACGAGTYCSVQAGEAACAASKCEPGEALCDGSVATTCAADGAGPKPGGTDCASQGQVCVAGSCRGKLCTPQERLCQHEDVYVCSANGASLELFADCTGNEVCDVALATCRSRLCEPGKLSCDANRVVTCNDSGTGWVQSGTDCSTNNGLCVEGSCKPVVCKPNSTFCRNGDVYSCDTLGVKETLSSDCSPATQHCWSSGNYAYCERNTCTPNQPVCDYNRLLTTCNAEGSGPLPGGKSCGDDKICSDGECVPKVCEPSRTFCKDGDVHWCYSDGLTYYRQYECLEDMRCVDDAASSPKCEPFACLTGEPACLANTGGTCAADGLGLVQGAVSCAVDGKVCSTSGACAETVQDSLGLAEELVSQPKEYFVGDVIDVASDRKLLEVKAGLALAAPRTLHWVIQEVTADSSYGTPVLEVTTKAAVGSGQYSSGALSVTLKAGKAYVIGVGAEEGGFAPYVDTMPFERRVSFGRFRASLVTRYGGPGYVGNSNVRTMYNLAFETSLP